MSWYNKSVIQQSKNNLLLEWNNILSQNFNEHYYQKYLSDHAGLFLGDDNCHLVIAKLKLGSELETDFVTLTDNFSNGNLFELIEIKQPNTKLFTKKGLISSEFNRATQQVRDWKRWLIDNRSWFKKYLPTTTTRVVTNSHLKFKIIIGRRLTNPYEIEKRNQIGEEIGAEIRSFDYLTDKLRSRTFFPTAWLSNENRYFKEELANPFFKAISDSEWKKFCNKKQLATSHFYSHHYEDIINNRKYNNYNFSNNII